MGRGWLKIRGWGVILAEGKSYLFSPVRDKRDHPNNCVNLRTEFFISSNCLWLFRKRIHTDNPDWLFIGSAPFDITPLPAAILPFVDFSPRFAIWMHPSDWPLPDPLCIDIPVLNYRNLHLLDEIREDVVKMLVFIPTTRGSAGYFYWSTGKFMIK